MLKDIFIPENLGSYYLFKTYILAFDIKKNSVIGVLTKASGYKRYIENIIEYNIEEDYLNNDLTYEEKVSNAINYIISNIGYYNKIFVNIPSYKVIFKDLELPPLSPSKIYQVLPFEIENIIPFSLDDAEYDFIIINSDNKNTNILVSIVKKFYIFEYLDIFSSLNISLNKFSTSIVNLYKFYKSVYKIPNEYNDIVLVDISDLDTKVVIISKDIIKYIRSINKGIMQNAISDISSLDDILSDVSLTLESYINQNGASIVNFDLVLISGLVVDSSFLDSKVKSYINYKIDYLNLDKIINKKYNKLEIIDKSQKVKNRYLDTILLSLSLDENFNIYKDLSYNIEYNNIKRNIIVFLSLSLLLFSIFLSFFAIKIINLRSYYNSSYNETLTAIKTNIKLKEDSTDLNIVNNAAKRAISKDHALRQNLIDRNRYFLLKYLIELSKVIDLKTTRLNLITLSIKKDEIKLYGEVPNHNFLNKLQNSLKESPLFKNINKLQVYNFKTEPIIIKVDSD